MGACINLIKKRRTYTKEHMRRMYSLPYSGPTIPTCKSSYHHVSDYINRSYINQRVAEILHGERP